MKFRPHVSLIAVVLFSLAFTTTSSAQLLNSWEGGLEDWTPRAGMTLSNTFGGPNQGTGVTDGTDSLQVTVPAEGFQRWGERNFSGQALTDIQTAAQNPLLSRFEFDVTYDTSLIPQGSVTFINQQLAMNTDSGWSQWDFGTELTDGMTDETLHFAVPLSRFGTLSPGSSPVILLFAVNSNWGAGLPGTLFYDNLLISEIVPDLDDSGLIDINDWTIFIGAHLTDISGLSFDERFGLGDLDSDGDNDFEDFVIFEAGFDAANGVGSFQDMLASIPEPATAVFFLLGGLVMLTARRRRAKCAIVALCCVGWLFPATTFAQLLNSWETGLESWIVTDFGNPPTSIATSTSFPTDGSQSLAVTNDEDGFFWSTKVNYGSADAQFTAFADAVDVGISNYALEFDVTFDTDSIPTGVTTSSISVALNSSGGWFEYGGLIGWDGVSTETAHVSIPLDQAVFPPTNGTGMLVPGSATTFYQVNLGIDGDWGIQPATFYFDKLELVQLTEPAMLMVEVDRADRTTRIMNDSGSGSVEFNYYTLTSGLMSLDRDGWDSLDSQNIDAVDGSDPGLDPGDSPGEGWDEAGGSDSTNLTEAFLLGSSTLGVGQSFAIGQAYNNSVDAQDLVFRYQDLTRPNRLTTGTVVYINEPSADCDFTGDSNCTGDDINLLVAEIAAVTNDPSFDLTGDGLVDLADRDEWLAQAGAMNLASMNPYQLGDATLDGTVDGQDFLAWNTNKFAMIAAWTAGDFNADGTVDGPDFLIWNSNKFTSADGGVSSVPEPAAAGLALLGLLGLWLYRCD